MSHDALIAKIEREADALTDRVLAEMLRDPFWHARFGERAEKHGRQDGRFHLQYVQQALASGEPNVMVQYARWLQQVLTTRGMCSRHLAENFDRLAAAIGEWPDGAPAVAMLHAATAALRYPDGPARALQDRAATLPELTGQQQEILSYAADALALEDPQVFRRHVTWRNVPLAELHALVGLVPELRPLVGR